MITIGQVKRIKWGSYIYLIGTYDADGSPAKAKVSGVPQFWKTRPKDFKLPVKRGLYDHGYVTQDNAARFTLKRPKDRKPAAKPKKMLRTPRPYYPQYGIR